MLNFLKRHTLAVALILTLITAFAVLAISAEMDAREIRDSVLRFHIVANSNSETDQLNKMKVREGIATLTSELFSGAADTDDAEQNRQQMGMVLDGDSLDMATGSNSPKIQLKFKVVEFFQQLFHNVHI